MLSLVLMRSTYVLLLAGALFLLPQPIMAADATKPKPQKKAAAKSESKSSTKSAKSFESKTRSVEVVDFSDPKFYRYKFQSMMGMNIVGSSAFVSGFQMGYAPWKSKPLYVGPDLTFSLFSPGSLFSTLVGGWYDYRIKGAPRMTISLGAFAGPGFPSLLPEMNDTVLVVMALGAVTQEIDDLTSFRAEFRPGMTAQHFSFMMNLSLSFRFT